MTVSEITEHPALVASIIGILLSSLIGFITWWFKVIRKKIIDHIDRSDNVLVPQIHKKIDEVEEMLTSKHVEYIKLFASIDKRLVLLESNSKDIKKVLSILEVLSEKIEKTR